jgi:F-box associated protein
MDSNTPPDTGQGPGDGARFDVIIPPEVHGMIAEYLGFQDIINAALTSRNMRDLYSSSNYKEAIRRKVLIIEWAIRTPALGTGLQNAVVAYLKKGGGLTMWPS